MSVYSKIMKDLKNYFYYLLLVIFITPSFIYSQSAPITIDGIFDDWTPNLTTFTDTNESKDGIDLLEFQVTNDAEYLYIRVKANKEFDLTGDNPILHNFFLYLDTDDNANTGFKVRDDYGAELSVEFANRIVYNNFAGTPEPQLKFANIEFRSAPTVTSNEFEIAIGRDAIPDGVNPLFPNSTLKILLRNRENFDWLPNLNTVFTYTFNDTPVPAYMPIDFNKTNNSFIRVMAYNTLQNSLLDSNKLLAYERIFKAVKPDIIGLVESANTTTTYIKSLFDNWLPLGNSNGWYVAKHGGEVTVSKWPISQTWDNLTRQFPVLIDLPESYGTDLLYTNAHLNCCAADAARQDQVDQYAAFILDAKSPGGTITIPQNTPIIYSGDLNLVGLSQQLNTLVTGDIQNTTTYGNGGPLDWDNSNMKEENALQSDIRMNYTWRSDSSSFPPGKLDFMIFSDYTLTSEKSFVIQTEVMSSNRLNLYDLLSSDTTTASDHFPVIADFSIKNTLSNTEETILTSFAYPNPVFDIINLTFGKFNTYSIIIYNHIGLQVLSTKIKEINHKIDISNLASGVYYLKIQNKEGKTKILKIIKK